MEKKGLFPGVYGYKDVIRFKSKGKIFEGYIVGLTVNVHTEEIIYKVHSTENMKTPFYFKSVSESNIIK